MKQDQIKLVFIGDIKTGKTTFSKYLIDGYKSINFEEYNESNGASYAAKTLVSNNQN